MAAFTLGSKEEKTVSSIKDIFDFIGDFRHFKKILPEDKVEDFTFDENQCSFTIRGITPMTVKIAEKKPYEFIRFTSDGLGKFNFELLVSFSGDSIAQGTCRVDLSGDLNPILLSFAKEPLHQLANTMCYKLAALNEDVLRGRSD